MSRIVIPSWFEKIYPLLAVIGIIDTFYLINIHNNPGVCSVDESSLWLPIDCGSVARSEYSVLLGVPVAVWGLLYYLSVVLVFLYRDKITFLPVDGIMAVGGIVTFGMGFSIWLVYLQLAVLEVICLYCMGSAATTTILFSLFWFQWYKSTKNSPQITSTE